MTKTTCPHKRTFSPPLSQRRHFDGTPVKASEIICSLCVQESNAQFYATLRAKAEQERKSRDTITPTESTTCPGTVRIP